VRTHGWSGSAPATDEEAIDRILAAASKAIDERGADFSIADVARTVGVTRQTVYRYFPSTDALLVAAAVHAASGFLDRLTAHLQGITNPADAVAEAVATALEWLPEDKHLGLLVGPGRPNPHTESVTSDVALDFAHSMVRRLDVDWFGLGFTDAELDELAEHLLRIIQSFVIDPGRPPRCGEELRDYLRRWVGAAMRPSAEPTIRPPSAEPTIRPPSAEPTIRPPSAEPTIRPPSAEATSSARIQTPGRR
jgi:AcrR family transcriptional regulator